MAISGRYFTQFPWILMVVFLACSCKSTYSLKPACTPSSCGDIRNISFPFRLKTDPKHCGQVFHTLNCETNITFLDLPSIGKYYVKKINYHNQTIRVADPGFQKNNCSSVPLYSSPLLMDFFDFHSVYGYSNEMKTTIPVFPDYTVYISASISFFKCSQPVNSSLYPYLRHSANTDACNDNGTSSSSLSVPKKYGYVVYGGIGSGDVEEGCSLEWMSMAPSQFILVNETNGSVSWVDRYNGSVSWIDRYHELVDGFELAFYVGTNVPCEGWYDYGICFPHTVAGTTIQSEGAISEVKEPHYNHKE